MFNLDFFTILFLFDFFVYLILRHRCLIIYLFIFVEYTVSLIDIFNFKQLKFVFVLVNFYFKFNFLLTCANRSQRDRCTFYLTAFLLYCFLIRLFNFYISLIHLITVLYGNIFEKPYSFHVFSVVHYPDIWSLEMCQIDKCLVWHKRIRINPIAMTSVQFALIASKWINEV